MMALFSKKYAKEWQYVSNLHSSAAMNVIQWVHPGVKECKRPIWELCQWTICNTDQNEPAYYYATNLEREVRKVVFEGGVEKVKQKRNRSKKRIEKRDAKRRKQAEEKRKLEEQRRKFLHRKSAELYNRGKSGLTTREAYDQAERLWEDKLNSK